MSAAGAGDVSAAAAGDLSAAAATGDIADAAAEDACVALRARMLALDPAERAWVLARLTERQQREFDARWDERAHDGQLAPAGDWRVWVIRAGRGFGKTRAGAEWVSGVARDQPGARIALVGATEEDVRRVMIEGEAGLRAVARIGEAIDYRKSLGEVRFASGATGYVYSAGAPEKLRGPEHHAAWCDELAKWRYGEAAWDNLVLGLRLGAAPRVLVTTTPKPVNLMRRVAAGQGVHQTIGRTRDNPHLPTSFVADMEALYGGSRLGRQELEGELLDDAEGALWTRGGIEACRVTAAPALVRVVVAVDPPAGIGGDACGIVCVALGADGLGYVIEDASVRGLSPEGWARAVADCARRHGADRVVAEKNQGGEMVRSVLEAADTAMPLRLVHAARGKVARAEPVAALYERGRVRHVAAFPALEDELCGMVVGGTYAGAGRSPDRADALVWGLTELMLVHQARVAVHVM